MILNDTLWDIHPSQVVLDSGKVYVNDFYFSHKDRHLRINGIVSPHPEDTVRLDLKEINIGYVFDIADLGVNFKGEATGPAFASGVLEKPVMSTDLFIRNLGLNEGLLGDANIHGEWHHDVKGIYLDAHIQEKDIAKSHVYGYVYPLKPTSSLDLQIEAGGTNLKFIHHYMSSITPEFNGRATGHVHFYGKFKALTMEGRVFGDASMKVDVLNTTFSVKDSIYIEPGGLTFRNNRIFDTQGHQGSMSGYLHYQHFKNLEYRFNFNVNDMLVMNTKESPDYPFYGTVYGTGNATIAGNAQDGVNIDVAMTTNRNTTFTYIKDNVSTAVSNQFIKFVDKTPRRAVQDSVRLSDYEIAQKEIEEASVKVMMGPEKKSHVVTDEERRLTAYHETGHAITGYFSKHHDPVHQISIISRGGAGGYTMYLPEKDPSYVTKTAMFENIVTLLGGRVAEQLVLEDISTGASSDLQRATDTARAMVTRYGFSERMGPVVYGSDPGETFLGRDFGQGKGYSEAIASEIDNEIRDIVDEAYETARRTLTEHMNELHKVAGVLMEREKISGEEFKTLMEGGTLPPYDLGRGETAQPEAPAPDSAAPVQPAEQPETQQPAEPANPQPDTQE